MRVFQVVRAEVNRNTCCVAQSSQSNRPLQTGFNPDPWPPCNIHAAALRAPYIHSSGIERIGASLPPSQASLCARYMTGSRSNRPFRQRRVRLAGQLARCESASRHATERHRHHLRRREWPLAPPRPLHAARENGATERIACHRCNLPGAHQPASLAGHAAATSADRDGQEGSASPCDKLGRPRCPGVINFCRTHSWCGPNAGAPVIISNSPETLFRPHEPLDQGDR